MQLTSASILKEALAACNNECRNGAFIQDALCRALNLEPTEHSGAIVSLLRNHYISLEREIEAAKLEQEEKRLFQSWLENFKSLKDYTAFSNAVSTGHGILDPRKLELLQAIHPAIVNSVGIEEPSSDAINQILESINEIDEALEGLALPEGLREAILVRCNQIQLSLKKFRLFGHAVVAESLKTLTGEIEITLGTIKPAQRRALKASYSNFRISSEAIISADRTARVLIGWVREGMRLIRFSPDNA